MRILLVTFLLSFLSCGPILENRTWSGAQVLCAQYLRGSKPAIILQIRASNNSDIRSHFLKVTVKGEELLLPLRYNNTKSDLFFTLSLISTELPTIFIESLEDKYSCGENELLELLEEASLIAADKETGKQIRLGKRSDFQLHVGVIAPQ